MLAGANPHDIDTLGRALRTAWLDFVRTGTPATDATWPPFTAAVPIVHHWRP